jgi:hypothetical protein
MKVARRVVQVHIPFHLGQDISCGKTKQDHNQADG